jgi:hypothetical protein
LSIEFLFRDFFAAFSSAPKFPSLQHATKPSVTVFNSSQRAQIYFASAVSFDCRRCAFKIIGG